ncbi:MAG: hypothetical protein ACJ75G_11160 [Gaiellaceae bacterium]
MNDAPLDSLLDQLVTAEPSDAWGDVLVRARRGRRRYIAIVVAVAALVLVPATWAAIRAFEGTPAPQPVRKAFDFSNQATAKAAKYLGRQLPQADLDKAHGVVQVQTKAGPLDLWAAPSTQGGTCFFVGYEADMLGSDLQLGTSGCLQGNEPPLAASTFFSELPEPWIVYGWATGAETTVEMKLEEGPTLTLPVVEHYFLGAIPNGSVLESVTGYDAAGNTIGTWTPPD